jgi:hypothetical protein
MAVVIDIILASFYTRFQELLSSTGSNTTGKGMVLGAKRSTTLPSGTHAHEHSHMGSEIGQ